MPERTATNDQRPMSYETAVAQMYALGHELAETPSRKFDLAHMRVLLSALGHPENSFPAVLVAGTNGKGSTAATLASILRASGLKTGLYTSPHLVRINERIRLHGMPISDDDFVMLHDVVDRTAERLVGEGDLPWHPSFFEMLTAMGFEYFARSRPDMVVLEVGMGGRLDATNVVEPRLSIITDISLDHQKYLGETVGEIAREKAGIIRPGGIVVTLPQLPEANDVIGNAILDAGARAVNVVPYVPPVSPGSSQYLVPSTWETASRGRRQRYPLAVLGKEIVVDSPMVGRHQLRNLALAIGAAEELHNQGTAQITPETIARGIRETYWPGRFQVVPAAGDDPEYVLDVAHNPAGAWALRSTLSAAYPDPENRDAGKGRAITMVFGVMRDKAMQEMAEILFPIAERVIVTHASNPRSASPDEIRQAAARVAASVAIEGAEDVASALERARKVAGAGGLVVVTGSIYIVGETMRILGVRI
ncbi:MAG TPA: folylpolyglutamate synthase/dihydrofolate synthase family protein [Bryobacteraceae bacterium]|nr:folylpolyglutamate synthase/dihydrofolate synthase family protein [Bryobacteraceae bacterium]